MAAAVVNVAPAAAAVALLALGVIESKLPPPPPGYNPYLDTAVCRTVPGLTWGQIGLCLKHPDAAKAAMQGLTLAVKECQHQFETSRWNCSGLATKGQNPHVANIMKRGLKETAFAYAMASAGVAISIAKACSLGQLSSCGCDSKIYKMRKPRASIDPLNPSAQPVSWKWGGCSHNLRYGVKFSKMFLDSREKADDVRSKTNLHNNQVGRTMLSDQMQIKCKCHGISGSCQLKTCWRAVPDIHVIGRALKEKYRTATFINQGNLGTKNKFRFNKKNFTFFRINTNKKRKAQSRAKNWIYKQNKSKRDLSHNLLYYEKSPNFCESDSSLDFPGTTGRVCNSSKSAESEPNSCSNLCCGRGYDQVKHRVERRCNCKFVWCCEVKCQKCVEDWISVCK